MTLENFIKKWSGKELDFDGYYGTQCMDLMHQYVYEVLDIKDKTVLAAPGARDVYNHFRWGDLFDKIPNTPTGVPKKGDIIFWGYAPYGHVAVFVEGNVNNFTSFDANYPEGTLPHLQTHDYAHVLGWLRPKDPCYNLRLKIEEMEESLVIANNLVEDLKSDKEELQAEVTHLTDKIHGLTKAYQEKQHSKELDEVVATDYEDLCHKYKDQVEKNFKLDEKNLELSSRLKQSEADITRIYETNLSMTDYVYSTYLLIKRGWKLIGEKIKRKR